MGALAALVSVLAGAALVLPWVWLAWVQGQQKGRRDQARRLRAAFEEGKRQEKQSPR